MARTRDVFEWTLASYVWLVMKWGLPSSSGRSVSMSQPVSVTNRVCSNWAERRPSWGREGGGQLTGETLATRIIWMTGPAHSWLCILYTQQPQAHHLCHSINSCNGRLLRKHWLRTTCLRIVKYLQKNFVNRNLYAKFAKIVLPRNFPLYVIHSPCTPDHAVLHRHSCTDTAQPVGLVNIPYNII